MKPVSGPAFIVGLAILNLVAALGLILYGMFYG